MAIFLSPQSKQIRTPLQLNSERIHTGIFNCLLTLDFEHNASVEGVIIGVVEENEQRGVDLQPLSWSHAVVPHIWAQVLV